MPQGSTKVPDIAGDETWIQFWTPEAKNVSKMWEKRRGLAAIFRKSITE